MAASMASMLMLYEARSMSTNTGVAPFSEMAPAVAMNVNEVVMTSSPGPMSRARNARWRASVPLAQATAQGVPR